MLSAAAPIQDNVLEFLKIATSCPALEGYGQTETSGPSCFTCVQDPKSGHVGGPTTNTEIKILSVPEMDYSVTDRDQEGILTPRGELLVRGPLVFQGYFKDSDKTDQTIDRDGWLSSGDIVRLNPNGSINIIDRKKNIFKLS